MEKVHYLLQNLRNFKVIVPSSDSSGGHLIYKSSDTLLIRYQSERVLYSVWLLVSRSSNSYYRVIALSSLYDNDIVYRQIFKNLGSTCQWIKNLIRRY